MTGDDDCKRIQERDNRLDGTGRCRSQSVDDDVTKCKADCVGDCPFFVVARCTHVDRIRLVA